MATLQKIRNRAGVLVAIIIGLALGAFILGDLFRSGRSLFQRKQMEIANIDGQTFQYTDFQKKADQLSEIYKMNSGKNQVDESMWEQIREQTWQAMVRDALMNKVYKKLGLAVSPDELYDMVQGSNISPIVKSLFTDRSTGTFDRSNVIRFLKGLETNATPEQREYWLYLEKEISDERALTKYDNLIKLGLYTTNEEAQQELNEKNNIVNFNYIALPYSSVNDSLISVSQADLKNYYDSHKQAYKQEESRNIEYVTFPVNPSAQDDQDAKNWITNIKSDFSTATDNVQFVNSNSDVEFEDRWYKQGQLPKNVDSWVFDENAKVDDILGPYVDGEAYKLAKVLKYEMRPDSVRARHILLSLTANATQQEKDKKKALADSLKTAIEKGSDFASLARQFSDDQGSALKGGDVGFFAYPQMVKPFADAAFNNKVGEISVVESQYGYHVVQTTQRGPEFRKVQVAFLVRNIVPSDETYQKVYADVSKFASENTTKEKFDAAIVKQKLTKKTATIHKNDQNITGLENSRSLIRAAYDAQEPSLLVDTNESSIFEIGDNFILAALVNIKEAGTAPFEDVRANVELAVRKEKKAQYLIAKAKGVMAKENDLIVIAHDLNSEVKTADNVNFTSLSIPNLGIEPALIGTVTALGKGKISSPVEGNNGVYIAEVTKITEGTDKNVAAEQQQLSQSLGYQASNQAYQTIKDGAKIVDKRSKFY